MYANLFEHETIRDREKLNRIMDAVPATLSCSEIEREFTRRAIAAGLTAEDAEGYLIGDPSC